MKKSQPSRSEDPRSLATLIETFAAERHRRDPHTATMVLAYALSGAIRSWDELLAGGWILMAPVRVLDQCEIPGYGSARILQTIERFVRWLHEVGSLDAMEMERLRLTVEEARYCHGLRWRPSAAVLH